MGTVKSSAPLDIDRLPVSHPSFTRWLRLALTQRFATTLTGLITLGWGVTASPVAAIESIQVRVGPLSQQIQLQDLKAFTQTGRVPKELRIYRPLLTPQVQQTLQTRFMVDSDVGGLLLEEFLNSPGGEQLLVTLKSLLPNLSEADIVTAFEMAATDSDGLSIFGLLEAIPHKTLEINVTTLISLISQINLSRLESEALSRVLKQELETQEAGIPALSHFPAQPGPAKVEQWHLTLRDRQRDRAVPVDLYWSRESHGPLVIISHGFAADRHFYAYLAEHLASHGLTVASVEHSGSNVAAVSPPSSNLKKGRNTNFFPATEFIDRPKDISFVLDRLEQLNQDSYSLRGRINTDQTVLIGHSLGGYTGLALAGAPLDLENLAEFCQHGSISTLSPADWLQCAATDLPPRRLDLSDHRITRLIVMNPLTGQLFRPEGLQQVRVPTLMLASSRDQVTPIARQQLRPFTELSGPKALIVVVGGSHLSVGDPENLNPELGQVPFMPELPGYKTEGLRSYMQAVSLSFILQGTSAGKTYRSYLSPAYAQSFSDEYLQLRLSHGLPDSITAWLETTEHAANRRNQVVGYLPSLFQLEAIALQHRFRALQHQMMAYLRTSPPSMTALYLPNKLFRSSLHATEPKSSKTPQSPNHQRP
ncbi:dienelactone hydrolase [filamentous cyanobacterium CCP5]|nr:dienelactone hydrolase [filamentous cyanobacterium CCP5]